MNQQQSQNSSAARTLLSDASPTAEGRTVVADLAVRHGFSEPAVTELVWALHRGGGRQAQFNHPEFGGLGQWSSSGMLMIGDMFNNGLKAKVGALAEDAARALAQGSLFETSQAPASWSSAGSDAWPHDLGAPAATGSQNGVHYAFFPERRLLAFVHGGVTEIYDTEDHQIFGFGQQQGGSSSVTFTSQRGLVPLRSLRRVDGDPARSSAERVAGADSEAGRAPPPTSERAEPPVITPAFVAGSNDGSTLVALIESLAGLHAKGILSDDEFAAKKADLLARL